MKKTLSLLLALVLVISLVPTSFAHNLTTAGKVSVYVGDTIKWTANQWVWWTSGNPGVATIDQNGNIKALKAGQSHITATAANGTKKTVTLTVYNKPNTALTLTGKVSVYVGDTAKWTANQWVWWTSGNPGVATIDQNGNIKALKAGQSHITATAANGTKKTVTLTVYNNIASKKGYFISQAAAHEKSEEAIEYKLNNDPEHMTMYKMTMASADILTIWSNFLDEIYTYLKSTMTSSEFAKLSADQAKWEKETEAYVDENSEYCLGGSMYPMVRASFRGEKTKTRCYNLLLLIK